MHIIFKYSSTRWLSRQEVISRILEQWEPLQYYFTLNNFEKNSENTKINFISSGLLDPLYKMVFYFLEYVLKIINSINLEMQSHDARIHIFLERLQFLFRQMARNFLKMEILDAKISEIDIYNNHIPLEHVYCGTDVDIYISTHNIEKDTIIKFNEIAKKII